MLENIDKFKILSETTINNSLSYALPELLFKKIKNSDPTVSSLVTAIYQIMSNVILPWETEGSEVGIIVVGNALPQVTTNKLIMELRNHGRVSPLNFINANAGAAISICCTLFKFQGPTMNLTNSDSTGIAAATILASNWLNKQLAKYIFLINADVDNKQEYTVNCKLLVA